MVQNPRRAGSDFSSLLRRLLAAGLVLLGGCAPPAPPTAADLDYPVIVLFERSGIVAHDDATDLRTMSVQRIVHSHTPPYLVDSRLDIYRLHKLSSVHGGLWLMTHPSGHSEVDFELERVARADAAQARRLIAARDPTLRAGADPATLTRLQQAGTLAAMRAALEP